MTDLTPLPGKDDGPMMWSQDYRLSPEMPEDLIREIAIERADSIAEELGVPVDEMHVWWGGYDYLDPLMDNLTIGWRSDWGTNCKNRCNLHRPSPGDEQVRGTHSA